MNREERLKLMNDVVVGYADEFGLNAWLSVIPDGETPECFKEIATNNKLYKETLQVFARIISTDKVVTSEYVKLLDEMIEEDYQI